MLGKRSSWFIKYDGVDSSFTWQAPKKQRISTEEELLQLEPVTERVLLWFTTNSHNLPKTEDKLTRLLSSLCKISVTIDPQIVYFHLLLNGVLREDPQTGEVQINWQFNESLRGFVLDSSGLSPTLSPDFCVTLQRTVSWCLANRSPPKTREAFISCLKQLCTFRREVPCGDILRQLTQREYISISPNGTVDYSLLHNHPSIGHYMPCEC